MIWNDYLYFWTDSRVLANRNFLFGVGRLRKVRICLQLVLLGFVVSVFVRCRKSWGFVDYFGDYGWRKWVRIFEETLDWCFGLSSEKSGYFLGSFQSGREGSIFLGCVRVLPG